MTTHDAIMNETKTKKFMEIYRRYSSRQKEIKEELYLLKKEIIFLSEERDEEIESKQFFQKMQLIKSGNSAKMVSSKVEKTLDFVEYDKKQIQICIQILSQEYRQIQPILDKINALIDLLPTDESQLLMAHYQDNTPMRIIAGGDSEKRVKLWRLERKARKSLANVLRLHQQTQWVYNLIEENEKIVN